MSQGMTAEDRERRYGRRPIQVDCRLCQGKGAEFQGYKVAGKVFCGWCGGSGLDAIPWSEVMTFDRDVTAYLEWLDGK